MKKLLKFTVFVLCILSVLPIGMVSAAITASISPSSGTVGKNFSISVNINTGGAEINGVDLDVTYDGDVSFVSGTAGNLGCTPTVQDDVDEVVGLPCFIPPGDTFSGSGRLATLNFTASSDGQVVFDIENFDAGGGEGSVSGATLTVDMDYTGGSDAGNGDDESLPETGFFTDNIFLILGGLFLVVGIVVAAVPETWNWMTIKKKKEAKAKEKFEKDVVSKAD